MTSLPKNYRRDCLPGALSALLMLVGDLCLSLIPASPGDSGLFLREAYLNGSYPTWRLPLLLGTGLMGMALGVFTVRVSNQQILPQYRCAAFLDRLPGRLDQPACAANGPRGNGAADSGAIRPADAGDVFFLCGHDPDDAHRRVGGSDPENFAAPMDGAVPSGALADSFRPHSGSSAGPGRGGLHLGFRAESVLRKRGAVDLDAGQRLLGPAAGCIRLRGKLSCPFLKTHVSPPGWAAK